MKYDLYFWGGRGFFEMYIWMEFVILLLLWLFFYVFLYMEIKLCFRLRKKLFICYYDLYVIDYFISNGKIIINIFFWYEYYIYD